MSDKKELVVAPPEHRLRSNRFAHMMHQDMQNHLSASTQNSSIDIIDDVAEIIELVMGQILKGKQLEDMAEEENISRFVFLAKQILQLQNARIKIQTAEQFLHTKDSLEANILRIKSQVQGAIEMVVGEHTNVLKVRRENGDKLTVEEETIIKTAQQVGADIWLECGSRWEAGRQRQIEGERGL